MTAHIQQKHLSSVNSAEELAIANTMAHYTGNSISSASDTEELVLNHEATPEKKVENNPEEKPVEKTCKKTLTMNDYKKFKYIENVEAKYELGKHLGSGSFGEVRRCKLISTGCEFAIKIMKKENIATRKVYLELLENELSILGSKSHPKIIRIVDLLED